LYLDQRSWQILKAIADNPAVTGKDLEQQMEASRKQIGYSIDKINEYLQENGMPRLERLRTGKFQVPAVVIREFRSEEPDTKEMVYIYSDRERLYLILLILLCHEEELSTWHFTDELKISKNTLLLDMKKLQELLDEYHVTVFYSRKSGYTVLCSEFEKRELLVMAVRKILRFPKGETELFRLCKLEQEKLNRIKADIEEIENSLQIQFTDERMNELPYILYLIFLRIDRGRSLEELPETFAHIVGTREYRTVAEFADKYGIDGRLERMFLTAQIQISNINSLLTLNHEAEDQMKQAAEQVIRNFESICCIQFMEKEPLREALLQHWRPAFYRIRYRYHLENSIRELVLPRYAQLHEIAKKAVVPFEEMLEQEIPEEEMVYITVLFGSWLRKEGRLNLLEEKRRAIVVCANGISVSSYLFTTLRELLPEVEFVTWMSVREFQEYRDPYDIVFATVHLETEKLQFLVKPFLNEESKQKFRSRFFREIEGIDLPGGKVSQLLAIIEKYTTIHAKEQLTRDIYRCLHNEIQPAGEGQRKVNRISELDLLDLLNSRTIQICSGLLFWEDAIKLAAMPLLEDHSIETRYVDTMIRLIQEDEPFIMVADGVIYAHAGVNDGVNRVGMSLLRLPEKISVKGYMEADIIVVICTPDNNAHLNALFQLNTFFEGQKNLDMLREAVTSEEILDQLKRRGEIL